MSRGSDPLSVIGRALVPALLVLACAAPVAAQQAPLAITAPSPLPTGEAGLPYTADLGIRNGAPPYAVSVVQGLLPQGLSTSSTGIAGTPSTAGASTFTVRVMDQMNASASKAFSVTIQPAVRVTTTTLKPLKANTSYTTTLTATGGKPPYTWSLADGSLPVGLTLSATGVMSGTSGGLGVSAFTVRATDGLGGFDDQALQLAVNLGPLSATCTPPIGEVGVAYSQPACVPKLGLPPYTCALLSGTPSAGTTLNGDCTLSGTPATPGSKTFVTRVADSGGLFLNVGTTQTVLSAVRVTTTTLRPLKANTSYTTTLAATLGKPPYTWSLAGGSLPAGLNLSATGVVSGTSGVLGVSAFTVRATDGLGGVDDQPLQLAVNLGPLSATCAPPIGEVGVAYSQPACVPKLGLPPYTCALLSGTPSAGTTLHGDCTLSGTPTTPGSKPFVTRVADSGGLFLNVGTTQTVLRAVQIATTTLRPLKANTSYTTTLAVTGGKPPYTWSLAGGSLPAGLNLSATGVVSGTSGVLGVSAFTVRATDGLGGVDDQPLQLAVNGGPLSATCAPPIGEVGVAYSQTGVRAEARPAAVHVRPPERHAGRRHHAERRLHAERHTDRRPAARHS